MAGSIFVACLDGSTCGETDICWRIDPAGQVVSTCDRIDFLSNDSGGFTYGKTELLAL